MSQELTELVQRDSVLREVFAHAIEEHPRECCGMILAIGTVRRCENAIDRYHESDPVSFPRTSANGYSFSIDDLRFLSDSSHAADPVRIVYHSHPTGDARFSNADREAAMPGGTPLYPQLAHLIVGVVGDRIREARLYAFIDGDYREVTRLDGQSDQRTSL